MTFSDFWAALVDAHVSWLGFGFSGFGGWQIAAYTLLTTHVTIIAVTVFLHRSQAHRSLDLHPAVNHFFRLWLWLSTGIETRQWVAVHRKHHARCDREGDPHSPQTRGLKAILLTGSELYRGEAQNGHTIEQFGRGTPDDWLEKHLYARYSWHGVGITLMLNLFLFGAIGATVWAVQMLWIPVTAAGIVNGIGHWWGYRNFEAPDASRNFMPWGLLIGGEELHNNHHTYPTSAKLSIRPFELDIGWVYIRMLQVLGLATVRRVAPRLRFSRVHAATPADSATLSTVVTHRFELMAAYAKRVRAATRRELRTPDPAGADGHRLLAIRSARRWLHRDDDNVPANAREQVARALAHSTHLTVLVAMREKLRRLWTSTHLTTDELVADLQAWLREAEQSGIKSLREFAHSLRTASA